MKKLLIIFLAVILGGCAQTQWSHSTNSEAQFQMDSASCRNEAMRNLPQQVAAPVAPIYVPPTQYNTTCSNLGNFVNCSTASQGNYSAQLAQRNAQQMAQAGSDIGTGIAQGQFFENCMLSRGYKKQINIDKSLSNDAIQKAQAYNSEIKSLGDEYRSKVCTLESLKLIFDKSPCNSGLISLTHLSDLSKINEVEKPIFEEWNKIVTNYSERANDITIKYVLPPLGNELVRLTRKQKNDELNERVIPLYKGEMTWGEFNKFRSSSFIKNSQERSDLISKYK